jgi:3-hydroxybutyryl-CoA dehydratase
MKVGDKYSFTNKISETRNKKFAELVGDFNPVHFDKERTAKTHFGKPITNGILTTTTIGSAIVQMLCDNDHMVIAIEQHNTFVKPVFIGDIITANIEIDELLNDSDCWITAVVKNQNDESVMAARFRVRVLDA